MLWLILCAISSAGIYVVFKMLGKIKAPLFNAIIINYIVAAFCGFCLNGNVSVESIINSNWLMQSMIIGVLFIAMFFIIGLSSQKAGISITTVASKMSVVIPMLFAIVAFNENLGIIKVLGILLALAALSLSVYKKTDKKSEFKVIIILLPLILFIGMGIVDSTVIYSKEVYVDDSLASIFSATAFAFAFLTGIIFSFFNSKIYKKFLIRKVWAYGVILGLCNFGSFYFMIRALNSGIFQNSVVYGIINIGIVTLSVLAGTLFFNEKLSIINKIGIVLSIFAIGILTMADYNFYG